jgi:hypothetical protein
MTEIRPGVVLWAAFGVAGLLAVAAALVDADVWRACAVVALLVLAALAVSSRRGRTAGAGAGLLAMAVAVRAWWGDTLPEGIFGLSQPGLNAELVRYWDAVLARERLAAGVLLAAVVAFAASVGVRWPARSGRRLPSGGGAVLRRWPAAVAVVVALLPAVVVADGIGDRWGFGPEQTGADAARLAWELAPAAVAVVVAAVAAGFAAGRGWTATGGAVLLGAVAAASADAVADASRNVALYSDTTTFLSVGIRMSAGAVRWDWDGALAATVLLAAPALLVLASRRSGPPSRPDGTPEIPDDPAG